MIQARTKFRRRKNYLKNLEKLWKKAKTKTKNSVKKN